jgi:hypothetical protein
MKSAPDERTTAGAGRLISPPLPTDTSVVPPLLRHSWRLALWPTAPWTIRAFKPAAPLNSVCGPRVKVFGKPIAGTPRFARAAEAVSPPVPP